MPVTVTDFDALTAARELEAAGIDRHQAKVIAKTVRDAAGADRDALATQTNLAALEARMTATLYRALWIQGAGIIAILTALRFLPF